MGRYFSYAGHVVKQRFSQNFLIVDSILTRLLAEISPQENDCICEIGPGLGALTKYLWKDISSKTKGKSGLLSRSSLIVLEIDRDLVARLEAMYGTQITVICCDVLKFDFIKLYNLLYAENNELKFRVVGNLPYNISTPILFYLSDIVDIVADQQFVLQKEVVDRMIAKPGTKSYGKMSVVLQQQYHLEKVFDIPPSSFRPIPAVMSSVVHMIPKSIDQRKEVDLHVLSNIVHHAFSQRRKKLKNSLQFLESRIDLKNLGVNLDKRAEELTVEEYVSISKYVQMIK